MKFVDLNRHFVAIGKDEEPNLTIGRMWGVKYAGWLDWPALLKRDRVVLLAEAASGKTEEFTNAAQSLRAGGSIAFFARIENLADGQFLPGPDDQAVLKRWRAGQERAWFFLDSLDEARLNRKSFDDALRFFSGQLGGELARASVLVSCRVSDWRSRADRIAISGILPVVHAPPPPAPPPDRDAALLDPIFKETNARHDRSKKQDEPEDLEDGLLVVQLVPLSDGQRRTLAAASGVPDVDAFIAAIAQYGLDVLAECPGDLLELADYWKLHRRFGSLREMTESSVQAKLRELDRYRADNEALTEDMARRGAERLAGALTLAKTFTLVAPGTEPDPTLAAGALDPGAALGEWNTAQTNALLRRGIFAPSTYGRVRFHHRATQEYLAGQWLKRLLDNGCERAEIEGLLFVEAYGVKTVAPSLRAVAAWLALERPEFQNEIIEREPILLLTHGDPGSLALDIRAKLLLHLARRHAEGEVADDSMDRRALWMFATPALADAVRKAWTINARADFRADLVRLIREGKIVACRDLAAKMAMDTAASDYARIAAAEALLACGAAKEIAALRRWLLSKKAKPSGKLAAGIAKAFFPTFLSVADLLHLIKRSEPSTDRTFDGFSYAIEEIWQACPPADRPAFVDGIAALCAGPPYVEDYRRVAKDHAGLARELGGIAHDAVAALGDDAPSRGLITLLSVVERAERGVRDRDLKPPLHALVRGHKKLEQQLFWYDVAEVRAARINKGSAVTAHWAVFFGGAPLWALDASDLAWLTEDLKTRTLEDDRRVALSAVVAILGKELKVHAAALRKSIKGDTALEADLRAALAPSKPNPALVKEDRAHKAYERRRAAQEKKSKASWLKFRENLAANPARLADPKSVNWLLNLTEWLRRKTQEDYAKAATEWRQLESAFGPEVAQAYRAGMKALWRATSPVRPARAPGGPITIKWTTILSIAGLAIEASDNPKFVTTLSSTEAVRAALHACLSNQGYPAWLDSLMAASPANVLPIVRDAFREEWSTSTGASYLLYHFAKEPSAILPALASDLFTIITAAEPPELNMLDRGIEILRSPNFDDAQRKSARTLALTQFKAHAAGPDPKPEWAARYLGLLFFLDPTEAFRTFAAWIRKQVKKRKRKLAETVLALLFGRHDPLAYAGLPGAPVTTLEPLLLMTYQLIRPEHDNVHEGSFTPDTRDDAESARNAVLKALIDTTGPEAHAAMLRLSRHRDMKNRSIRFRELARRMAERDADPPAWSPAQVLAFERDRTLPVTTPDQLYRAAKGVLLQIASDFDHEDASSRAVLETARDENAVQTYLAEQLRLRAKGRYHVTRENEVAEGNMPDIQLSATQAGCELAVEAKHGGKGWSTKMLEAALRGQLAEDYLRPLQRRRGILVVTNHKKRGWKHPATNKPLTFGEMIAYLESKAAKIGRNKVGDISVCVVGIDALPRERTRKAKKTRKPARKATKRAVKAR
jgi:hypothetical protein